MKEEMFYVGVVHIPANTLPEKFADKGGWYIVGSKDLVLNSKDRFEIIPKVFKTEAEGKAWFDKVLNLMDSEGMTFERFKTVMRGQMIANSVKPEERNAKLNEFFETDPEMRAMISGKSEEVAESIIGDILRGKIPESADDAIDEKLGLTTVYIGWLKVPGGYSPVLSADGTPDMAKGLIIHWIFRDKNDYVKWQKMFGIYCRSVEIGELFNAMLDAHTELTGHNVIGWENLPLQKWVDGLKEAGKHYVLVEQKEL